MAAAAPVSPNPKHEANRANATHSTGPADTSRTRFNSVSHGLTSKQNVIPGESQADYDEFRTHMLGDLAAGSSLEILLAERAVAAAWRLKRFIRMEAAFFNNRIDAYTEANPQAEPDAALANLFADPAEMARMRLFLRYQTAVQREYDTAIRELQKAKAERAHQAFEQALYANARPSQTPKPQPQPTAPASAQAHGGFASYAVPSPTTPIASQPPQSYIPI